ncbi:MAG: prolipoprotein diacylglyceryl transferase [Porticoccaceae bacterium]
MSLNYPQIDPVAFALGPIQVHWYGLMYLFGFGGAWLLAIRRSDRAWSPVHRQKVEDLVVYMAFGVILGGRFGYVLFYNFDKWLADPLWLLRIWEGGMAFHGGLLGVIVAMVIFARQVHQPMLAIADFVAPLVPIGLGLGRIGNFIGQELWGRQTDGAWGMVFPRDPEQLARHPSQLYQAFLEGLVLFVILFWFSKKPRPTGVVSGLFLMIYGLFRFVVEFAREPDAHIGFDALGWLTRGQLLSLPMIVAGAILIGYSLWRDHSNKKSGNPLS